MVRKSILLLTIAALVHTLFYSDLLKIKQTIAATEGLPEPTQMVETSSFYSSPQLKAIKVDPKNPLNIEFIIDKNSTTKVTQQEINKLMSYFLAGLTVPLKDMWVNLSPYEKDRIVPQALGKTQMGRNLLAQDYILKQLSSSLTHPDTTQGSKYWSQISNLESRISNLAETKSFSKIWIVPETAEIYEENFQAFITNSSLDIKTETDYLASQSQHSNPVNPVNPRHVGGQAAQKTLIPTIKKEVNKGKNFAELRQIYSALILATWFKKKYMNTFYKHYLNHNKTKGINLANPKSKQNIFNLYVQSFKKGVYNVTRKKRRYFSGGFSGGSLGDVFSVTQVKPQIVSSNVKVSVALNVIDKDLLGPDKATQASSALKKIGLTAGVLTFLMSLNAIGGKYDKQAFKQAHEVLLDIDRSINRFRQNSNKPHLNSRQIDALLVQLFAGRLDERSFKELYFGIYSGLYRSDNFQEASRQNSNRFFNLPGPYGDIFDYLDAELSPSKSKVEKELYTTCALIAYLADKRIKRTGASGFISAEAVGHQTSFIKKNNGKYQIFDFSLGIDYQKEFDLENDYLHIDGVYYLKDLKGLTANDIKQYKTMLHTQGIDGLQKFLSKYSLAQRWVLTFAVLDLYDNFKISIYQNLLTSTYKAKDYGKALMFARLAQYSDPDNLKLKAKFLGVYAKVAHALDPINKAKYAPIAEQLAGEVQSSLWEFRKRKSKSKSETMNLAEDFYKRIELLLNIYKRSYVSNIVANHLISLDKKTTLASLNADINGHLDLVYRGQKTGKLKTKKLIFTGLGLDLKLLEEIYKKELKAMQKPSDKTKVRALFAEVVMAVLRMDSSLAYQKLKAAVDLMGISSSDETQIKQNLALMFFKAAKTLFTAHGSTIADDMLAEGRKLSKNPSTKAKQALKEFYKEMINAYINAGQYQQASDKLKQALKIFVGYQEFNDLYGIVCYKVGLEKFEKQDSDGIYATAEDMGKNSALWYLNLSIRYFKHTANTKMKRYRKRAQQQVEYIENLQTKQQGSSSIVGGIDLQLMSKIPVKSVDAHVLNVDFFNKKAFQGFSIEIKN